MMLRRRSEAPVLAARTLLLVGLKHRWRIAHIISYLSYDQKGRSFVTAAVAAASTYQIITYVPGI